MPEKQDDQEMQAADWSHQLRQARQTVVEEVGDDEDEDSEEYEDEAETADLTEPESIEHIGEKVAAGAGKSEAVNANTLRQLARQNQARKLATATAGKLKSSGFGSSQLARWAWESILGTGGISILFAWLYLNVHVFLHLVLGEKAFCTLGKEWPSVDERSSAGLVAVENSLLALVDIIVFCVVLVLLASIYLLYAFIERLDPTTSAFWINIFNTVSHIVNPVGPTL